MAMWWRAAGLTYVKYSNVAAKVVRRALKPEFLKDAAQRDRCSINITKWIDGKPVKSASQQKKTK